MSDNSPLSRIDSANTVPAKCMDCGARFRLPLRLTETVRCPDCLSTQVLDFNVVAFEPTPEGNALG